jgi:hypothetical protein
MGKNGRVRGHEYFSAFSAISAVKGIAHAKAQRAPSKRSILLLPFLKIFLPHCFRKYPHFFLFSIARDIMPPKAAKFSKTKEIFASFAPWREEIG